MEVNSLIIEHSELITAALNYNVEGLLEVSSLQDGSPVSEYEEDPLV